MSFLRLNRPANKEQGFTLVELLIVILIIGILSVIAVPAFLNQRKQAVDASLKSDIHQLSIELFTWKIKNPSKRFPNMALREADTTQGNGTHNAANLNFIPSPGTYVRVYTSALAGASESFCITAWNAGSSTYQTESTGMKYYQSNGVIGEGDCVESAS